MSRAALQDEYLRYTKKLLPEMARKQKWVVRLDHCFQRILLDNLFQTCWYNAIKERPAYKQLSEEQLEKALQLAKEIEQRGNEYLVELNKNSLRLRGKG